MANLIILRGLPASGKSTWAKAWVAEDPENRARVNRDKLRELLHDGVFIKGSKDNPGTEKTVIAAQLAMVEKFLKAGLDVVDDNTNLPNRSVRQLVEAAEKVGAEWEIKDFTNVQVGELLSRNFSRNEEALERHGEPVLDDQVVTDLHQKFVAGKEYPLPFEMTAKPEFQVVPYVPNPNKPRAVIVDIDGTVALMDGRSPYDYTRVHEDLPNWPVIHLVNLLTNAGYKPIFLSGRKAMALDATWYWLTRYVSNMNHAELHTREVDDNRADWIVKYELFNEHVRDNYAVRYVLDDRNQVVEMWRELGLTCLQVADGNF